MTTLSKANSLSSLANKSASQLSEMAAASAVTMHSTAIAIPVTRVMNKPTFANQLVAPARSQRSAALRVRCSAEDQDGPKDQDISTPTPAHPTTPKVMSTKFGDVLAFSGPAPERINGRLAMVGFVSAMAAEVSSGQDLLTQISSGGAPLFVGISVLLSLASLIPLFKGVSVQSKSDGIMTSDAELWNGRFAMLGLVALAFTEYVKGGALV